MNGNATDMEQALMGGSLLDIERVAKNPANPEEERKRAGLRLIEISRKEGRKTNLLYMLGSARFLDEVRAEAGKELIKMGESLELLALGERYFYALRVEAGMELLGRLEKQGREDALAFIAGRKGYPAEVQQAARNILDSKELMKKQLEIMDRLRKSRPPMPKTAAPEKAAIKG